MKLILSFAASEASAGLAACPANQDAPASDLDVSAAGAALVAPSNEFDGAGNATESADSSAGAGENRFNGY